MAQAIPDSERIALHVETTYDGQGIRAARQDNSALGREAKAASAELAAAAQQGSAAEKGLAAAAREAAAEQDKVAVSADKMREIIAQSGGNLSRMKELLRDYVTELKNATQAQAGLANAPAVAGVSTGVLHGPWPAGANPLGPDPAPINQQLDKIPGKARSAANALSTMAFAAADGNTATRALAVGAGSAADAVAMLSGSAKVAAGAAGIGALVTILGTVLVLLERADAKAKEAGASIASSLGQMADNALKMQAEISERRVAEQQQRAAAMARVAEGLTDPMQRTIAGWLAMREQRELERMMAEQETVFKETLTRRRDASRKASEDEGRQQEHDLHRYKDMLGEMARSAQDHYNQRTQSAEGAARLRVEREFSERLDEIKKLKVHEDQKTELIAAAARDRAEQLLRIHLDAAERQNAVEAKLYEQQRQRADRALELVKDQMESALHAAITGGETFIQAATKMLLAPLVRRLEALAVQHGIEALVELAFGNFTRAGAHAAVSSAAVLAAQKVAGWAGMTAGAGSGGSVGGPSLSSRDPRESPTNVTVVIQTVNPYSRELMGETMYQLHRAGVLKQPIYAPPTSGAQLA